MTADCHRQKKTTSTYVYRLRPTSARRQPCLIHRIDNTIIGLYMQGPYIIGSEQEEEEYLGHLSYRDSTQLLTAVVHFIVQSSALTYRSWPGDGRTAGREGGLVLVPGALWWSVRPSVAVLRVPERQPPPPATENSVGRSGVSGDAGIKYYQGCVHYVTSRPTGGVVRSRFSLGMSLLSVYSHHFVFFQIPLTRCMFCVGPTLCTTSMMK